MFGSRVVVFFALTAPLPDPTPTTPSNTPRPKTDRNGPYWTFCKLSEVGDRGGLVGGGGGVREKRKSLVKGHWNAPDISKVVLRVKFEEKFAFF